MKLTLSLGSSNYAVDLQKPLDIAIPVHFDEAQLSAFGAPPATKKVYKAGDFTGSVAMGGSCNCETYTITPHCNGTHTECAGHVLEAPLAIQDVMRDNLVAASVVTIVPEPTENGPEGDTVITDLMIENAIGERDLDFMDALVIRTYPNDKDKVRRDYGTAMPPYFTPAAMRYIANMDIKHLLVDMPSVDRLDDGGKLENHRIFWGMDAGARALEKPSFKTITELVYVPDAVPDGSYLLNLQVAAFRADAAPSRPVLYEVEKI